MMKLFFLPAATALLLSCSTLEVKGRATKWLTSWQEDSCFQGSIKLDPRVKADACVWSEGSICYAVLSQRCASDPNCSNLVRKELQSCQTEYPDRQKKTIGYPLRRSEA